MDVRLTKSRNEATRRPATLEDDTRSVCKALVAELHGCQRVESYASGNRSTATAELEIAVHEVRRLISDPSDLDAVQNGGVFQREVTEVVERVAVNHNRLQHGRFIDGERALSEFGRDVSIGVLRERVAANPDGLQLRQLSDDALLDIGEAVAADDDLLQVGVLGQIQLPREVLTNPVSRDKHLNRFGHEFESSGRVHDAKPSLLHQLHHWSKSGVLREPGRV